MLRKYSVLFGVLAIAGFAAAALAWFHLETPVPTPIHLAIVMPMSGSEVQVGRMVVNAAHLRLDAVNKAGGINGHHVVLDVFDDEGKPEVAKQRAQEIVAGPAVAVIGHYTSATSTAAGAVYHAGHMPAITGSSNADSLTVGNPYFFRVTFDTSAQGAALAAYVKDVFGNSHASVLYTDEEFGRSLNAAFQDEFHEARGTVPFQWRWDPHASPKEHAALMDEVALKIGYDNPGVVILAMSPYTEAREAVTLLRRRGVNPVLIGASALDTRFPELFKEEPEEKAEPGFFTKNLYAAATVLYDSANDRGTEFEHSYVQRYAAEPSASAASYYETALMLTEALRRAGLQLTGAARDGDRQKIRDWLAAQTDPGAAIKGPTGLLYFGANQTVPEAVRIGRSVKQRFISAPVQLDAVPNPALIDLDKQLQAGDVVRVGQAFYSLQRVVYTGIDVNRISQVNASKGTFAADFYLWFRYTGDDKVLNVDFNAAADKSPYDPQKPLEATEANGLKYRLYRVQGEFTSTFDFHDYPFDAQSLLLRLSNRSMPRQQVVYAIDTGGLRLPRADHGISELGSLANWTFTGVSYLPDTLRSTSTRGNPGALQGKYETEYSGFDVIVGVQRKTLVFLIKSLLPLILLVMVVYVTLHFPVSLTKERLSIAISAMLASAVLLSGINTQLTDVGYTTAIEYGFYAFFALCLFCVITALAVERLHAAKLHHVAVRGDMVARVVYILSAVGLFVAYLTHYNV